MSPRMTWEMRYRAFLPVFFAVLGTFSAVRATMGIPMDADFRAKLEALVARAVAWRDGTPRLRDGYDILDDLAALAIPPAQDVPTLPPIGTHVRWIGDAAESVLTRVVLHWTTGDDRDAYEMESRDWPAHVESGGFVFLTEATDAE